MDIVLYTTGCPRCRGLRQILDEHKVRYTDCTDVNTMLELGISSVPVLSVDGKLMKYDEAIEWAMRRGGIDEEQ